MKNKLFFLIYLCSYFTANAQFYNNLDSDRYLMAYNYIINDSINQGKIIAVSDSIIDLDRYWFSEELKKFPIEQERLNEYRENKNYTWFTTFYSSCLSMLFKDKNQLANHVIFFSKVEDNMLLADLLPHTRQFDKFNYDEMAFQNVGRTYLFIFGKKGGLKAVFSREMIYD